MNLDIPNLNQLLLNAGISQRSIMNWFGFNVHGYVLPNYLKAHTKAGRAYQVLIGSKYEFAFTSETYDLFMHSLYQKIRYGLLITDINNFIFCILVVRFLLLLFRYNFITSFKITLISLVCALFWRHHLLENFEQASIILGHTPYFRSIVWSYNEIDDDKARALRSRLSDGSIHFGEGILFKRQFQKMWSHIAHGYVYFDKETKEGHMYREHLIPAQQEQAYIAGKARALRYHIDPAALLARYLERSGLPMGHFAPKIYYLFERYLNPKFITQIFPVLWDHVSNGLFYTVVVRMGKQYLPYGIRWHYTMITMLDSIQPYTFEVWRRAYIYAEFSLLPRYNAYFEYGPNKFFYATHKGAAARDIAALKTPFAKELLFYLLFLQLIAALMFMGNFYAMLHAAAGQYFYIPFFTENVELHAGPRIKTSIYSGGLTAWQDLPKNSMKLWHGWFGRGTDTPSIFTLLFLLVKWIIFKILGILRLKKPLLRFFKFLRDKINKNNKDKD